MLFSMVFCCILLVLLDIACYPKVNEYLGLVFGKDWQTTIFYRFSFILFIELLTTYCD